MDTTIVSYNSRGFPRNDIQLNNNPFVSKIVNNSDVFFACFQETFYTKQDLSFLNNIHPNFHGVGTATTDEKLGFIQGHPPGGVAILWRKQYDSIVKPLTFSYDWIVGIELSFNSKSCVILNVYMPYECQDNEEAYQHNLASIECILID